MKNTDPAYQIIKRHTAWTWQIHHYKCLTQGSIDRTKFKIANKKIKIKKETINAPQYR